MSEKSKNKGICMKRIVYIAVMLLAAGAAHPADDPVARAMKLYEKHRYAEAITLLRSEMSSIDAPRQSAARLTLGMSYLKNAELHRRLYRMSSAVYADYLGKLSSRGGASRSRLADLYLGETFIESGRTDLAISPLERFIADTSAPEREKAFAKIDLGIAHALKGDTAKAEELWSGVNSADPEIKSELAAAYARSRLMDRNPASLMDEAVGQAKKTGKPISMRLLKNALSVYAQAGMTDKGLALANSTDLKAFSYRESIGKSKVINFYDLSLLSDLAELYLQAAIQEIEKAAADARLKDTANFYLGEALALAGKLDQSIKAYAAFISQTQMPQQLRDRASARQAANHYQKGRQFDAIGMWDELSQKQPEDPEVIAEVLFSCSGIKVDCPKAANKATASVEVGEGRRYAVLNIALGSYFLAKRDYSKAAVYLEAGRDKGNKNRIEYNDPAMLVDLAEAYYRTKKFSEALEIYFEMSKQFPEVRQIQEALQGIYSMEHKSAGDVKIF